MRFGGNPIEGSNPSLSATLYPYTAGHALGSISPALLPPGERAGMRLSLWVAGWGRREHNMPTVLTRSVTLLAALALIFAGAAPVRAAVPDNQQQLTTFVPSADISSCAGTSISTNPTTGKTLVAFIQPDAETASGGMLVVGLLDANGGLASGLTEVSVTISSADPDGYQPPNLSAGPDGTWLVVWPYFSPTFNGIAGQLISSTGTLSGANFYISDDKDSNIETVSAAWSAVDSRHLVTWKSIVSNRDISLGELNGEQIVGQFVDGTGSLIGSNFLVTNFADGVDNNQDLAYGNGIWIAVSSRAGETPYGQIITSAGLQGAAFELSSDAQTYYGPGIAYNSATNQFLASFWEDTGERTKHLRLLSGTGTPIGNSVTSIGRAAFYAFPGMDSVANALTNVTIPDSVTSIGDEAFGGNRLTSVTFLGNAPTAGDGVFIANSGLIAVTRTSTATGWGSTWSGVAVVIAGLPETNRDGSVWTTALVILAGLTAAAGIGLRVRGAKRA